MYQWKTGGYWIRYFLISSIQYVSLANSEVLLLATRPAKEIWTLWGCFMWNLAIFKNQKLHWLEYNQIEQKLCIVICADTLLSLNLWDSFFKMLWGWFETICCNNNISYILLRLQLKALLHGHSYTAHAMGCTAAAKAIKSFKDQKKNPNLTQEGNALKEVRNFIFNETAIFEGAK